MRKNIVLAMIKIAQTTPSVCEQIADRLWKVLGEKLTDRAVALFYRIKPDFSKMKMKMDALRLELGGDIYPLFIDAIMQYDESEKASFETFVTTKIYWKFVEDKCENSERTAHEVPASQLSPEDLMTQDETLSFADYYSDDFDLTNDGPCDDNEDEDTSWKELLALALKMVEEYPVLKEFMKTHRETLEYCDRYEEVETAERMGCSRPTVYNRFNQIRKILVENGLDKEFYRLAA